MTPEETARLAEIAGKVGKLDLDGLADRLALASECTGVARRTGTRAVGRLFDDAREALDVLREAYSDAVEVADGRWLAEQEAEG